jgi:choline dehydrogenase-like flavoprotein
MFPEKVRVTPRPKKKDLDRCPATEEISNAGYNQCYDEFEKFLPSEEDLIKIIKKNGQFMYHGQESILIASHCEKIAQALHKRLRGN